MRTLYASSAVAVIPSEYEGFGLPAAEAMACGTPVVSTDGGALPEVVGEAGRIVPAGNSDALASAIGALLQDPASRAALGKLGRARIEKTFSWSQAANQMTAFYHQVLA
jgi:glycosyltransferase involved in cell wall biosynthesis